MTSPFFHHYFYVSNLHRSSTLSSIDLTLDSDDEYVMFSQRSSSIHTEDDDISSVLLENNIQTEISPDIIEDSQISSTSFSQGNIKFVLFLTFRFSI